ncbi:hypothetical protein BJ912DRAFT_310247 [Pholiota molesta]|nr:hypothetical protein BJ912DRAFT_310247 [Pholiota molesta]
MSPGSYDSEPITNEVENLWLGWKRSTFLIPSDPPTPEACRLSARYPCTACTTLETFDVLHPSFDQNGDLEADRQSLVRQINNRHDPLSYYLPFELAARVFMIYYDDTRYAESVQLRTSILDTATPLRLASVCTRWRDIAFDIPALWSSLRITYNPLWYTQASLVAQWLARSGTRPLFIRIAFAKDSEYTKRSRREIAPLFNTIRQYSERWKVLNLFIPTKLCKAFLGKFPVEAPLLENLQLDITKVIYIDPSPIVTLVTPRLKELHMWGLWLATVDVGWTNCLTSVLATRPSIDEIFEILARAPGLLECAFIDICDDSLAYKIPPIFTHTSLRSMKLVPKDYMEDDDVMYTLFERLALPSLRKLTYDFQRSNISLGLDNFSRFLAHSGKGLTFLSLENIEFHCITPSFILASLELLPTLTELSLTCSETNMAWSTLPDFLFKRLASLDDGFLPNLRTLIYHGLKLNSQAWNTLVIPLGNLATALKHSMTRQKNSDHKRRPLHTVYFALDTKLPKDDFIIVPLRVFRYLLRISKNGINLKITEKRWEKQKNIEELDLLLHFTATMTFSEFDNFPAYWFDDVVPVDRV